MGKRLEALIKNYLGTTRNRETAIREITAAVKSDRELLLELVDHRIDDLVRRAVGKVSPLRRLPHRGPTRTTAAHREGLRRLARANINSLLHTEIRPGLLLKDARKSEIEEAAGETEVLAKWLWKIARAMPDSKKTVADVFTNERLMNLKLMAGPLRG